MYGLDVEEGVFPSDTDGAHGGRKRDSIGSHEWLHATFVDRRSDQLAVDQHSPPGPSTLVCLSTHLQANAHE
jgi:hypothetical protein